MPIDYMDYKDYKDYIHISILPGLQGLQGLYPYYMDYKDFNLKIILKSCNVRSTLLKLKLLKLPKSSKYLFKNFELLKNIRTRD